MRHDDDEPTTSPDQDAWVELATRLRAELAKRVPEVGAMKVDEVAQFVAAVRDAYWLHLLTACWDKKVELELARISAE